MPRLSLRTLLEGLAAEINGTIQERCRDSGLEQSCLGVPGDKGWLAHCEQMPSSPHQLKTWCPNSANQGLEALEICNPWHGLWCLASVNFLKLLRAVDIEETQ